MEEEMKEPTASLRDQFRCPFCTRVYKTDRKLRSPQLRPCTTCARANGIAHPSHWSHEQG